MKATRCMVCTRTQEWEDFSVPVHFCDTYVWVWECGCLFFLTHPPPPSLFLCCCLCLWKHLRVCLSACVYNMTGVWSLPPESAWFKVCPVQTHTHTHTGFLCCEALNCLLLAFHIQAGTQSYKNLPSPQKDDCSLSLSHSLSFPLHSPSLIFSRALSHSFTLSSRSNRLRLAVRKCTSVIILS